MNKYIEYFRNYIFMNYDMNDDKIILKYYHSIRVAWLMYTLANRLNLSEEDSVLAFKIGLCHDLGRFEEVVRNGKFDNLRFDHGAYSNKILYNDEFVKYMDISEHLLFRKAIYYHNKKEISEDFTPREELFVKMLRDCDKIDLLRIRCTKKRLQFKDLPTPVVEECYMNDKKIDMKDLHKRGGSDSVLFYLSFIKDLEYEASFDMLLDYNVFEELTNIIDVSPENSDLFNSLLNKIIENRKERRGIIYVR